MLKKTNRVSLVDQVVSQIEHLIEGGEWAVGDKVPPEIELMEKFDVSRNTLREAIRALVHAGLLETKQGSGTIVRSSSALEVAFNRHIEKSDLIETLEVRLALEREAAEMAAKYRTDESMAELEACMKQCQEAANKNDIEAFVKADIQFHKTMVKATNNQLMQDLYEYMTDSVHVSIRNIMIMDEDFNYDKAIHHDLMEAIRNQDVEGATMYVNAYIQAFKQQL